jgi:hypothetical protein
MKRYVDMPRTNVEKLKAGLAAAKAKGAPHALKEAIPVIVTLDNEKIYKGFAFEVRPNGLIMVQTINCDLGVQLSSISCAASANVAENDHKCM